LKAQIKISVAIMCVFQTAMAFLYQKACNSAYNCINRICFVDTLILNRLTQLPLSKWPWKISKTAKRTKE
jgi:hypothetical protein